MRKTWALVMAAAMAAASLTACSSSKPAETAAPETEAEAAETEETEAEAEAAGDQQEILVAAAASLQYVMEDKIQPAFEKENPDIKLSFTFDSSGKLQTQIEEGADADVFFSAAMKQMNALEDEGLVDADSVVELLENKIALIVPKDSTLGITGFEDITKAEKIALGATTSDQFDQVKVIGYAPEGSVSKVIYPVGVVSASTKKDAAQKFVDYLGTDDALSFFAEYGFTANK